MSWRDRITDDAPASGWRDRVRDDVSQLESGMHGIAQGATFGFADEIAGFLGAAKEQLSDWWNDEESGENFSQTYERRRDAARKMYGEAEEANPATFLGGEVLGSLAVPAPGASVLKAGSTAAKIGKGVGIGAGVGALEAAGRTEKDLTTTEGVGDVLGGAAIGGVLGGAIPAIGAGISKGKKAVVDRLSKVDPTDLRYDALRTTPAQASKELLDPKITEHRRALIKFAEKNQIFDKGTDPKVMIGETQKRLRLTGETLSKFAKHFDPAFEAIVARSGRHPTSVKSEILMFGKSQAKELLEGMASSGKISQKELEKALKTVDDTLELVNKKARDTGFIQAVREVRRGLDSRLTRADFQAGGAKAGSPKQRLKTAADTLRQVERRIVDVFDELHPDKGNEVSSKYRTVLNNYSNLKDLELEIANIKGGKILDREDVLTGAVALSIEGGLSLLTFGVGAIKKLSDFYKSPKGKLMFAKLVEGKYTDNTLKILAKVSDVPLSTLRQLHPDALSKLAQTIQKQTVSSVVEKNQ